MTIRQLHPGGGRARVRELRQEQTPAEKALWEMLRGRRLSGLKFRRQFPQAAFNDSDTRTLCGSVRAR